MKEEGGLGDGTELAQLRSTECEGEVILTMGVILPSQGGGSSPKS